MNGRRLFREYAQSLGKEAKSFVKVVDDWDGIATLYTKDNDNRTEETPFIYRDMVYWIIKTKKFKDS